MPVPGLATLARIAAKGLKPTSILRFATSQFSLGGFSQVFQELQFRYPDLTGRERVVIGNMAKRAARAADVLDSLRDVRVGQVPANPHLFGGDNLGRRSEAVVNVSIPRFPDETNRTLTSHRTFHLSFDDIPTHSDIMAELFRRLQAEEAARPESYRELDLASVDPSDIDIVSLFRAY